MDRGREKRDVEEVVEGEWEWEEEEEGRAEEGGGPAPASSSISRRWRAEGLLGARETIAERWVCGRAQRHLLLAITNGERRARTSQGRSAAQQRTGSEAAVDRGSRLCGAAAVVRPSHRR